MTDFQALFEASPAAYLVLAPDPAFTILAVTDAYLRVTATHRQALVGLPFFHTFPDHSEDPSASGALQASLARVLATGTADTLPVQWHDLQRKGPHGAAVEERHWSSTNTPVLAATGEVRYVIHHVLDVTDEIRQARAAKVERDEMASLSKTLAEQQRLQQQADAARAQAEFVSRRLQFTLDAAEIGDWDLDLETDQAFRSARHDRCFGYEQPQDAWGFERFISHVHPADREFVRQQFEQSLQQSKDWHFECRVIWPDASIHWIAAHGTIYQVEGVPKKMSGLVLDITQRKHIEAKLVEANTRKDEFLAMLAHELRNPLAPISAAADLLRLGHLRPEQLRQAAGVIARQVKHMTGLVDELLDASRVTRGKVVLDQLPVDLKSVLAAAMEQTRPLMEAHRHDLQVRLAPDRALARGDEKRLVQVFANLLANAAKFTPEQGRITAVLTVSTDELKVTVADTGIGMEADLAERAFELFTQGERTVDRSQGGLGIGLALVRGLVTMHGGSVSVASGGAGHGSTFEVRLPRLLGADAAAPPAEPAAWAVPPLRSLRVLVVDDNQDAADLLGLLCVTLGHAAEVVYHPTDALARADAQPHDIYLLDLGLPGLDGHQLMHRLRVTSPDATFVAVTGYGMAQRADTGSGFDHYLVKPASMEALIAVLARPLPPPTQ